MWAAGVCVRRKQENGQPGRTNGRITVENKNIKFYNVDQVENVNGKRVSRLGRNKWAKRKKSEVPMWIIKMCSASNFAALLAIAARVRLLARNWWRLGSSGDSIREYYCVACVCVCLSSCDMPLVLRSCSVFLSAWYAAMFVALCLPNAHNVYRSIKYCPVFILSAQRSALKTIEKWK